MPQRTATLRIAPIARATAAGALALTLAAAPVPAPAQMTGAETADDPAGATADTRLGQEMPPLEKAVRSELAGIGVDSVDLDKYSSEQLAAILLTLTNEAETEERRSAIESVMDAGEEHTDPTTVEQVAGNEGLRDAVADALGRAGWSADVSQLTDMQVAALFDVLADEGNLETQRIEEVLP